MEFRRISVIGLGYVGLPTALLFASKGLEVVGVDIDREKIELLKKGILPLEEPGLHDLFKEAVEYNRIVFTTDIMDAKDCDAFIIVVPTPVKQGRTDLSYLENALRSISKVLDRGKLVVIESTVPPGTTDGFAREILEKETGLKAGRDFYLAHCPERIAPGKAIYEFINNPRLVGGIDEASTEYAAQLFSLVCRTVIKTSSRAAELSKVAENTFRDLNIAYANLLALLASENNIDVHEVIRLANTHPRVNIHLPGPGVGGPCLTKDPYMVIALARSSVTREFVELIRLARRINDYMPAYVVELIEKIARKHGIEKPVITVLGTAYKGDVNDDRESPGVKIVKLLLEKGYCVKVHDPYIRDGYDGEYFEVIEDSLKGSNIAVITTDHSVYREYDWVRAREYMATAILLDTKNIIDRDRERRLNEANIVVYKLGRDNIL